MLTDNLREVRANIEKALERSGRTGETVTLLAVSKKKPESDIMELYRAGHRDFGENYIQELRTKADHLPKDIRWHMIGHLQRNKVKYIAPYITMIHSLDSLELAETIEKEAVKNSRVIPVLVEVNVGKEESKFGLSVSEVPAFVEAVSAFPHVKIEGLMTSAPLVGDADEDRWVFRDLRQLSVDIKSKNINNVNMDVLSMGMSNDYVVAVEEGSTMVRVGTSIFGQRV